MHVNVSIQYRYVIVRSWFIRISSKWCQFSKWGTTIRLQRKRAEENGWKQQDYSFNRPLFLVSDEAPARVKTADQSREINLLTLKPSQASFSDFCRLHNPFSLWYFKMHMNGCIPNNMPVRLGFSRCLTTIQSFGAFQHCWLILDKLHLNGTFRS